MIYSDLVRKIYRIFTAAFWRVNVVIVLLLCNNFSQAQRLNTGFSIDFYSMHITKFPSDVFFAATSYRAYYIKKIQTPAKFNMNIGLNLIVDYSRFFVNTKLNVASTATSGVIYEYSYPIGGNGFSDYYSRIEYQQFEVSGTVGYFMNSRSYLRPYVEVGVGRTFPYFYREDMSFLKSFDKLWSDRYEMRDYLDLDKQYNFLILGFGYRGDMFSAYTRYNVRLGSQTVFYSNLTIGLAVYTKFSKLRKHYIYQPAD